MQAQLSTYLKQARIDAGITSQREAAEKLKKLLKGSQWKISQPLIAQYESGKIAPDPKILHGLAKLYRKDYLEVVFVLVRSKYEINKEWTQNHLQRERWELFEKALKRFSMVGGVDAKKENIEALQLRAKAVLIDNIEVLDLKGVAAWEKNFPNLEAFWVVAANAVDDRIPEIFDAIVYNLNRGVRYTYFLPAREVDTGGSFWQLQRDLAKLPQLKGSKVKNQVQAVPLEENCPQLYTNYAIANPHKREQRAGFEYVEVSSKTALGIRMANWRLEIIKDLAWLAESKGSDMEHVMPIKEKRAFIEGTSPGG
jgi:transcriptional regulator with XRE-family HTH domain